MIAMSERTGIDPQQLHDYIVKPAVMIVNQRYDRRAALLVLGTCAQESHCGRFIQQLSGGPAKGIFQMEKPTYLDIFNSFLVHKPQLKERCLSAIDFNSSGPVPFERLQYDLLWAAIMCRLHYFRFSKPLPGFSDIEGMAAYWKKYYNTYLGRGTVEEFVKNYYRFGIDRVEFD